MLHSMDNKQIQSMTKEMHTYEHGRLKDGHYDNFSEDDQDVVDRAKEHIGNLKGILDHAQKLN
jgi:hypothetical protein